MAKHRNCHSHGCYCNNAEIGISSVRMQTWPHESGMYELPIALTQGTLFKELDMPMNRRGGRCCESR